MSKLIYTGKTKNVFENTDGTYTLKLKDDATGKDGVFDPGENSVGLSIEGLGRESLKITKYYFEKFTKEGIPNHYISSNTDQVTMTVKPGKIFGQGLEFVCRVKANGSFLKRYGDYCQFSDKLNYFVEVTLKNDEKQDPPITKDAIVLLGIMSEKEYETCKELTIKAAKLIERDLTQKGMELHDIKFEFGTNNGDIMLIDEISAGCMRVYKDNTPVQPMELASLVSSD